MSETKPSAAAYTVVSVLCKALDVRATVDEGRLARMVDDIIGDLIVDTTRKAASGGVQYCGMHDRRYAVVCGGCVDESTALGQYLATTSPDTIQPGDEDASEADSMPSGRARAAAYDILEQWDDPATNTREAMLAAAAQIVDDHWGLLRHIEEMKYRQEIIQPGDVVTLASGGEPWTVATLYGSGGSMAQVWRERSGAMEQLDIPVAVLKASFDDAFEDVE